MSTNILTTCEEQVTTTETVHMCTTSPTAINRTVVVTLTRHNTIQSFIHYWKSSSLRAISLECPTSTITVESQKPCPISTITVESQKLCPISTVRPSPSTEHTCAPNSLDNDRVSTTDDTAQGGHGLGATVQCGLEAPVGLGAFTTVIFLALIAVTTGWVCTCVQIKLKQSGKYTVT